MKSNCTTNPRFFIRSLLLLSCVVATLGLVAAHPQPPEEDFEEGDPMHHECIQDTPEMQRLLHDGMDQVVPQVMKDRRFDPQAVGPIRFAVSSLDLDDPTKYCATETGTAADMKGGTLPCSADVILTAAKRTALLTHIIPEVLKRLNAALSVNQISGNLMVPSGGCGTFTKPADHISSGVPNADFVLYVAGAPTQSGVAAWAGYCHKDQTGRPFVGRANFNPKYIKWDGATAYDREIALNIATHEIIHALGVVGGNFQQTSTINIRGKTGVNIVSSPKVLEKAREYLNCPTLAGVELEDEGSAIGSVGSHWERRIFKEEVMSAMVQIGSSLSVITLAFFDDAGYYTVDYTKAEPMSFGKNGGCGFVNNKCDTVEGGKDTFFCFDTSTTVHCTSDYSSYGKCKTYTFTSDLPAHFQYFADPKVGGYTYMDGCPVVQGYSSVNCKAYKAEDSYYGNYWGDGGRCFKTSGLTQGSTGYPGCRCLQASCTASQVQFRVGGSTDWGSCPANGSEAWVAAPAGWKNNILCPTSNEFCDSNITVVPTSSPPTTTQAPTTRPPPPPPTTTTTRAPTPPPPTTTTQAPTPPPQVSTGTPATAAPPTTTTLPPAPIPTLATPTVAPKPTSTPPPPPLSTSPSPPSPTTATTTVAPKPTPPSPPLLTSPPATTTQAPTPTGTPPSPPTPTLLPPTNSTAPPANATLNATLSPPLNGSLIPTQPSNGSASPLNMSAPVGPNSTAVPSANASSPTAAPFTPTTRVVALVKGRVRLRGTRFKLLLDDPSHVFTLELTVRKDIAFVLNISFNHVAVVSMTIGSLVVDYEVDVSSSVSVETAKEAMLAEVGFSNFTNTQVLYSAVSTSGEVIVVEEASAQPAVIQSGSLCGTAFPHTDCLVVVFVSIAIFTLLIILVVVLCARRMRQKRARKQLEDDASAKEPYHQKYPSSVSCPTDTTTIEYQPQPKHQPDDAGPPYYY